MAVIWHFEQNGKSYGPFSAEQLKEMASTGQILLEDTVWKEGLDKRVPARKVQYLFEAAQLSSFAASSRQAVADPVVAQHAPQRPAPHSASMLEGAVPRDTPEPHLEPAYDPDPFPDDADLVPLEGDVPFSAVAEAPTPVAAPQPEKKPSAASDTAAAKPDRRKEHEHRQRRVISVKGATLMGQDGKHMKIRKKCLRCNRDDTSVVSVLIPSGNKSESFYCPKCRKNQNVEIVGAG